MIIGIHGLKNKPPKKILKRWWRTAIREGLENIGHKDSSFRFELVYWAHFLHPQPQNPYVTDKEHPLFIQFPYTPSTLLKRKKPSEWRKRLLNKFEEEMDKIFFKKDMSTHFSGLALLIMRYFFRDLYIYYAKYAIGHDHEAHPAKQILRDHLARMIKKHHKKRIMLIAHSMGSIIAYDVLTQTIPDQKIDTLITIGSPLGLPTIMGKFLAELRTKVPRTPENIAVNWFNFSDLDDKVAINYNLADDYEENSSHIHVIDKVVVNDYEHNGVKEPHASYGYLRTPELAEVVYEFLSRDRRRIQAVLCRVKSWFVRILRPL